MNIVLTPKDADFILKYIRMDARRVDESLNTLSKREENLEKSIDDVKKSGGSTYLAESLFQMAREIGTETKNDLKELQKDFSRCIELLTIGSEVTE
jgi:prefoldin subunit 5